MKEIKIGLLGFGTVGKVFSTSVQITDVVVNHFEKYQNFK